MRALVEFVNNSCILRVEFDVRPLFDKTDFLLKATTMLAVILVAASGNLLAEQADDDPLPASADELAEALLAAARDALPRETIDLIGEMDVRRPRGQTLHQYRFAMRMAYGQNPPEAHFTVYSNAGEFFRKLVVRRGTQPEAWFEDEAGERVLDPPGLQDTIGHSDLTWLDLTLDYLWWLHPRVVGDARIRGRECVIVEVTPPTAEGPPLGRMRLWLDREIAMLLQAAQLDSQGREVRRMWVRSVRRHDDQWMIRDLEVDSTGTGHRTRLHVVDFDLVP